MLPVMPATALTFAILGLQAGSPAQAPGPAPQPSTTQMVLKGKAPVSNDVLK